MTVAVAAAVKAHGARSLHGGDDACLGKEIEVAIDGAPTHALVDGANIEKDVFGGGVIAPCAHGVENQLALARVASQRRSL